MTPVMPEYREHQVQAIACPAPSYGACYEGLLLDAVQQVF